ncbi:antitoxin MazE7 [Streptomyces albireticuli]|uniref:Antitoxin MazE7 n=1 Tax=Streptomyces albireticuli TaxID=1940 RepID=A0A2A2D815_9ACTN|nr:antitoxin MazE7 [Streptomyces albireticuli]MCD9166173.1 antitoxin MazE7 [Streptomyces albireticuli]MCD9196477.1 antitoxin MazE7 [Streptomyces albireticuli]PAU47480.1 antitoxin MazE7 [Streptomyces albireticuli]
MADTSVRIDTSTRDRFKALAAARGMSLAAYLDELSKQQEHQAHLGQATAAFDAAVERPGFAEAFDAAFGGLPKVSGLSRSTSRAA